jgi:hypothetical protein
VGGGAVVAQQRRLHVADRAVSQTADDDVRAAHPHPQRVGDRDAHARRHQRLGIDRLVAAAAAQR